MGVFPHQLGARDLVENPQPAAGDAALRMPVLHRRLYLRRRQIGWRRGLVRYAADILGDLNVVTRTAMRVMCWQRETLTAFTARRPDVALALERSIGLDLQRRLETILAKLRPRHEAKP